MRCFKRLENQRLAGGVHVSHVLRWVAADLQLFQGDLSVEVRLW